MKITTILLLLALSTASASSFGQKVSLSEKNATLEKLVEKLRQQTGYGFLYPDALLEGSSKISINLQNVQLEEALKQILQDQPITFEIENNNVILKKKEPSFLDRAKSVILNLVQDLDARGKILDESGKPLEGATVVLKGTSRTAKTDVKGEFVIANVPDDGVLVIRYVGYKQLEISLKDAVMPLEIKLNVATGELEEVKVVYNTGYQELNKERATGSFVHIDNELFNRRVGATVLERIYDLVPGLLFTNRNTLDPLGNIDIRGISTFSTNTRPLLVVDNFIYEGDPSLLNPNAVGSITILKDAAAASIYGARAGNGVIVITMKKGEINTAPAISFNTNFTLGEKPDLFAMHVVKAPEVIALERKRFSEGYYDGVLSNNSFYPALSPIVEILVKQRSGAISATEANSQIAIYEQHDVRNDVNKYLLKTAVTQQYSLGISGGAANYRYHGSAGYDRDHPNEINKHKDRLTLNFSNIWNPIKSLEIEARLNWNNSKDQNNNGLNSYSEVMTSPYQRITDENGQALSIPHLYRIGYVDTVNFPGKLDWSYRPLNEAKNGNESSKNSSININGSVVYTIYKSLKINLGYSWQNATGIVTQIYGLNTFGTRNFINQFAQKGTNNLPIYPYPLGARYSRSNSAQTAWTYRGGLNFSQAFGNHDITSILGVEARESKTDNFISPPQYGYNPETNVFGAVMPGTWVTRPGGDSQIIRLISGALKGTLNRFRSYYGNLGYTYRQRYTFTASGRIDESNFFGVEANDRKKPLWSAGLKWDLFKEDFYRFSSIPRLSVRATYGYSGNVNAGTSPLATIGYLNPNSPLFVPYARIGTPPNPELKWENVRTINLGLDFELKNRYISGSLEFFQKRGEDLLSDITVDPTSGFSQYKGNNSSLETSGIDIGLNTKNLDGQFKWFSTLNFAYQKDKVIAYTVEPPKFGITETGASGFIIGKPRSSIYSYHWAGLNPLTGDAQAYLNGQIVGSTEYFNKRVQKDLIYHGQTNPPIFGNLRNDFNFRNLSLSIGMSYQFGYYFRRGSFGGILGGATITDGSSWVHKDYLDAWKVPGDELRTNIPGFLDSYPDARYLVYEGSDVLIEKGDHIRLQDIRLSYSLSKSSLKRLPFRQILVYAYANNLGIIWKASRYNPDTQERLVSITPKTIALGLNVNF